MKCSCIYYFHPIWKILGADNVPNTVLRDCEHREYRHSEMQTYFTSGHKWICTWSVRPTFIVRFGWNSVPEIYEQCCWSFASFVKIYARKAVKNCIHFCVHPETVRHFASSECVLEACVLRQRSQQLKSCFFLCRFLTGDSKFAYAPASNENFNNALNATQANTRCVRDIWQHLELCNCHLLPAGSS